MQAYESITPEREIKLEHASFDGVVHGTLAMRENGDVLFTYNEGDHSDLGSRLFRVSGTEVTDIFKTKLRFHEPVFDEAANAYVLSRGAMFDETGNLPIGPLFKISPEGELAWAYQLEGEVTEPPVIFQNSVFLCDVVIADKTSHLYHLNKKTGRLIWRKCFDGPVWSAPLILIDKGELVLGIQRSGDMLVLDLAGNIKRTLSGIGKWTDGNVFSRGKDNVFYACITPTESDPTIGHSLFAFNYKLDVIWSYKPAAQSVACPPVVDTENNLYFKQNNNRMVSLDAAGHERWTVPTHGIYYDQPIILQTGQILTATSVYNPKAKRNEAGRLTYLEIFSNQGEKVTEATMAGQIVRMISVGNSIAIATNTTIGHPKEMRATRIARLATFSMD